jgi:Protein of unknown function (DUF3754)
MRTFSAFCAYTGTICHYEYSETLDRLRDDYYYFSPEVAGLASSDRAKSDSAYHDLIQSLDKVLKDANFEELTHEDVADAYRKRTVPVEVKAEHDDFREVRFYKRGRRVEQFEVSAWFGLRRHEVKIEVLLMVATKTLAEIGSRRELRILKRRKIVPGSVLLKYFRNIACGDLYALFPNAHVVMSNFDKAFLGVPAIAGGIPILLKLYATISVLFLVIGIYFGRSGLVADADMKGALAALMGIVALGGFAMRCSGRNKYATSAFVLRSTCVEIAGPERALLSEIVARYLKAVRGPGESPSISGGQPAPVIACRVRDGHPPPVRTVRASGRGRAIYAVPAIAARRHARARNRR